MKISGEVFVRHGAEYVVVKVGSTSTEVRRASTGRMSQIQNSRLAAEFDRAGTLKAKRARAMLERLDKAKAAKS